MLLQNAQGVEIRSVEGWFRLAPPAKGEAQWKDGRSAKEQAKAWFRTGVARLPDELAALLGSQTAVAGFIPDVAQPELVTRLDEYTGGQRNHDMVVEGHANVRNAVMCVEAKSDEAFGDRIGKCLSESEAKEGLNLSGRIRSLSQAVFGNEPDEETKLLRYQLLHAVAGSLIEAGKRGASLAVFAVHEFLTDKTDQRRIDENTADFYRFVEVLPGMGNASIEVGKLVGPVEVPGGGLTPRGIPLFLGKASIDLRDSAASPS